MKTVTIEVVLPSELHAQWTRRSGDDAVSLNEAIIQCLRQHHRLSNTNGAHMREPQPALPQHSELAWGAAWSRRWTDAKAAKFEPHSDPGDDK